MGVDAFEYNGIALLVPDPEFEIKQLLLKDDLSHVIASALDLEPLRLTGLAVDEAELEMKVFWRALGSRKSEVIEWSMNGGVLCEAEAVEADWHLGRYVAFQAKGGQDG